MSGKFTIVRLTISGEHFEILVYPDAALNYKMGKKIEPSQVIAVDEVYSDASKGLRVSTEKLMKYFQTSDMSKVAEIVLKKGELQLTSEQRRRLIEDKRKQIVSIISKNYIDPKTGLPHPPLRIEQAMKEVKVSIDPFKDAEEQAKLVVDELRKILPLKSERLKVMVKIPSQYAPQSIGILKSFGDIQDEKWGSDGSLTVIIDIPAGVHSTLLDKLGSLTKGSAQASIMK
ncbi:MAG: ribosome assembly factor SBDS [Nitrososphaerota archaeon]|nr:ribosome assembly factor SBDS [Nitrososphaerota archaeon]